MQSYSILATIFFFFFLLIIHSRNYFVSVKNGLSQDLYYHSGQLLSAEQMNKSVLFVHVYKPSIRGV